MEVFYFESKVECWSEPNDLSKDGWRMEIGLRFKSVIIFSLIAHLKPILCSLAIVVKDYILTRMGNVRQTASV